MARRFINVIGRPRQVASARTVASIFLKPFDFQDRLPKRRNAVTPSCPYSRSRLTDPAFAGSVSHLPRRYADTPIRRQALSALHHRQFHEAGAVAGVEDLDRALLVVAWFGQQNVADVSLRITIVKGEPA
jgi:hypothetical protein